MTIRALRVSALSVAATLALTACGDGSGPDAASAEPAPAGDAAFPRTVEHAMGSTVIPEEPERVVVLDTGELDSAVSLGVTPVGAVTTAVSDDFLSYLAEDAEGVEVVGTIAEPNLEAIAALEPDLILSNKLRHEDLYDQLSQIAPTVFAEFVGVTWQENLLLAAEALGEEDEARAALGQYEQRADEVGQELGDPADTTVSAIRFVEGTIRVYTGESFVGTVLEDVGLDQLELPTTDYPTFAQLGPEQLVQVDADIVLYASYGEADDSGEAAVVAGPLWPRLTAVQEGRAHAVPEDIFYTGVGLTAANLQLDALEELLAG